MFDRAMASVIATAAACAAAVMAVFACGFALYALVEPQLGPAGAAAVVALVAALAVAVFALVAAQRARARERESQVAQAQLMEELPLGLGDIARDRPLVTLGVTALGGILAARHPTLVRDLIHIVARFGGRTR
jgi:protein-S-isoprenylcysteine O-methyltransferase Ste14